jgi:nucleoside-diphosphate-sugar epimerase
LNPQIWGTGDETRDFLFIEDAVNGYIKMAEHKAQGIFNFATGHQTKVMDVIGLIGNLMDVKITTEVLGNKEGEIKKQCLDWSKAHGILGWEAENVISEGLDKTVEWYRSYLANG